MTPIWDDRVAAWVGTQIWGRPDAFENARAMGVLRKDGKPAAGLVFHNWDPEAGIIEISAAAVDRRWLTRRVATEAMAYAFGLCGCQMVLARYDERNTSARKIWAALGSTETRIPRLYGRDVAGILATLTDDAWGASKFNEVTHGQQEQSTRAA